MGPGELDSLNKRVELLTNFSVVSLQQVNPLRAEIPTAYVAKTVKNVMPKPSTTKEAWFPVQTVFREAARKIIKYLLWGLLHIKVGRCKGVLAPLGPFNKVKSQAVAMLWTKKQEDMAPSSHRHLGISFGAPIVIFIIPDLVVRH